MVKLNFKTASPIKSTAPIPETPKTASTSEESPTEEELKIEETSEVTKISPMEEKGEEQFEIEEIEPETKKSTGKAKEFRFREDVFDDVSEGFDYQAGGGIIKTLFIIFIIIFILASSGFLLYKFTGIFNNLPFLSKGETTTKEPEVELTQTSEVPPTQTAPESISSPMLTIWLKNMGSNRFISSNLEKIMTQRTSFSRFSLIILTPNEINLTVLSDSQDKIARVKDDLNKLMPQLNFRAIATQEKIINRSRLIFADLSSKVPSNLIGAASASPQSGAPSNNLKIDLTNLSKKYKLKLEYFKSGKTVPGTQFTEIYYYMNISGNRDGMFGFLNELASNFPAIQINKISINPTNLVTYSDNLLFIRINFSYMN